jgi:hypothetical protein
MKDKSVLDQQIEAELQEKVRILGAALNALVEYGLARDQRVKEIAVKALKDAGLWTK